MMACRSATTPAVGLPLRRPGQPGGSVDWLCFPRFDAPALFARILDPDGGHSAIGPSATSRPAGLRRPDHGAGDHVPGRGRDVVLTDAMAVGRNKRGHGLGARAPGVLLRQLACTAGELDVEVSTLPVPSRPHLPDSRGGPRRAGRARRSWPTAAVRAFGLPGRRGYRHGAPAANRRADYSFALQHALMWEPPRPPGAPARSPTGSATPWRGGGPGRPSTRPTRAPARPGPPFRPGPSGADVRADRCDRRRAHHLAARDDRRRAATGTMHAWVRDSSFTMEALWVAACPDEAASSSASWPTRRRPRCSRDRLQIMFGVGGEHDLSERELPHLAGAGQPAGAGR